MNLIIKKFLFIIILLTLNIQNGVASNILIIAKIDNEIITNYDLEREIQYLKILNPSLKELNKNKLSSLAINTLSQEIIKTKELKKYIDIEQKNPLIEDYFKNLYQKLNFQNEKEFVDMLTKNKFYSPDRIKEKIKTELFWNEFIFSKYKNQIKIDKQKLIQKIENKLSNIEKEFLISEIVFQKKKNQSINSLISQIKLSIKEIGFNNTANIYSISSSAKLGGKVGWINEKNLSDLIIKKIENLRPGNYTETFKINNNFMILKLEDFRVTKVQIDKDKELEKLITFEQNRQLDRFSKIYFDKIKINYLTNES